MPKRQLHIGDFKDYFPNVDAEDIQPAVPAFVENVDFIFSPPGVLESLPGNRVIDTDPDDAANGLSAGNVTPLPNEEDGVVEYVFGAKGLGTAPVVTPPLMAVRPQRRSIFVINPEAGSNQYRTLDSGSGRERGSGGFLLPAPDMFTTASDGESVYVSQAWHSDDEPFKPLRVARNTISRWGTDPANDNYIVTEATIEAPLSSGTLASSTVNLQFDRDSYKNSGGGRLFQQKSIHTAVEYGTTELITYTWGDPADHRITEDANGNWIIPVVTNAAMRQLSTGDVLIVGVYTTNPQMQHTFNKVTISAISPATNNNDRGTITVGQIGNSEWGALTPISKFTAGTGPTRNIVANYVADPFFQAGKRYFYKCSYIYDGYQESTMSDLYLPEGIQFRLERDQSIVTTIREGVVEAERDTTSNVLKTETVHAGNVIHGCDLAAIPLTLTVNHRAGHRPPARVTHINIYRSATLFDDAEEPQDDGYRLVKTFDIQDDTGWAATPLSDTDNTTVSYDQDFSDGGEIGQLFFERTGISEAVPDMDIRYRLCVRAGNRMAVAGIWNVTEGFRRADILFSQVESFSIFNWLYDRLKTHRPVMAMQYFRGRLYAFEENYGYRINMERILIEDEYEGIGCASPASITVTDKGMFWASHQNFYWNNGGSVMAIGTPLRRNLEDMNSGYGQHDTSVDPVVLYSSEYNSVVFLYQQGSAIRGWMWNCDRSTWTTHLNFGTTNGTLRSGFVGHHGKIYMITSLNVQEIFGSSTMINGWKLRTNRIHFHQVKWKAYKLTFILDKPFTAPVVGADPGTQSRFIVRESVNGKAFVNTLTGADLKTGEIGQTVQVVETTNVNISNDDLYNIQFELFMSSGTSDVPKIKSIDLTIRTLTAESV